MLTGSWRRGPVSRVSSCWGCVVSMSDRDRQVAAIEAEMRAHAGADSFAQNGRLPDGCPQPEVQHLQGGAITMVQNSGKPLPGGLPGQ